MAPLGGAWGGGGQWAFFLIFFMKVIPLLRLKPVGLAERPRQRPGARRVCVGGEVSPFSPFFDYTPVTELQMVWA
jgi:hypothetical protein